MFYLADAAWFLLVPITLVLLSWCCAPADGPPLESSIVGGSAALGLLAVVAWWLGLHGPFAPPALLAAPVVACALLWMRRPAVVAGHARRVWRAVIALRGVDLALCIYLIVVWKLTLLLTLAPPSGNDYDTLMYHFAAPAQYLRAGRVAPLPYDHHTYFPSLMETLYGFGLRLRGPVFAKLFHWLMLPLSCAALVALGSRHQTRRAGLWAAAILASLPVIQSEASTGYIDLGLTAFVLLALLCLANWLETRRLGWALACGLFCGFCLATKYLGALYFFWLWLWLAGAMAMTRKADAKALLGGALLAVVVGGGWYLRNWVWTGNPVFPFAYGIFHGRGWDQAMADAYTRDQMHFGFGHGLLDFLLLPWRLAMAPLNALAFDANRPLGERLFMAPQPYWPVLPTLLSNGSAGAFETPGIFLQTLIGPVLLAFSLPLLVMRRKPALVGLVLWSFLFFWLFWAFTGQYLRYLIPAYAILCVACGWCVTVFLRRGALLRWVTTAMLCCWLLFTPLLTLWNARGVWMVVAGRLHPEQFLERSFPGYDAMRWLSTQTPPQARIAVYGEPRCFYLDRDYFWADQPHNKLIDYSEVHSASDLVNALSHLGADYVLWNTDAAHNGGFGGPPPQLREAILNGLTLVYESNGYQVLSVDGRKATP